LAESARIHGTQERRLGGTLLRTYRTKVDLDLVYRTSGSRALATK